MNSDRLVNLSFYRFYRVGDSTTLKALRERLIGLCKELDLRGTILIASEGVNAMMAGTQAAIDQFKNFAQTELGVEDRDFKEMPIEDNSFTRMLVKIKKEIISVGDPDLRPDEKTAPRIAPAELRKWLDEGRPITLLDTRNQYEIEVGTFEGANELGLETSRDFAKKASEWAKSSPNQPIVAFCTGGIRCEKASAVLMKLGLNEVYQLDGGILRYFEENGSKHFKGNCFVFDWRLAVDGELKPTPRSEDAEKQFGRHRS